MGNIRAGFGKEINTRKFNGKIYRLYDISHTKRAASQQAGKLRDSGYSARVIALENRWLVYYRQGK